jgi:hypothetical protein
MAMAGGDGMPKLDHAETNCNNCSVLYSADVLVPTKCGAGYCKSMGKEGVMDLESLRNGESDDGTGDLHQPLLENSKASIVQMKAGNPSCDGIEVFSQLLMLCLWLNLEYVPSQQYACPLNLLTHPKEVSIKVGPA